MSIELTDDEVTMVKWALEAPFGRPLKLLVRLDLVSQSINGKPSNLARLIPILEACEGMGWHADRLISALEGL